jgi:hypothetical protein
LRLRLKKAHDFGDGWMASDGAWLEWNY